MMAKLTADLNANLRILYKVEWERGMEVADSKNGVPIRLNQERWFHITEEHSEMAGRFFEVLEAIENLRPSTRADVRS